jgi:hypothetical protein
MYVKSVLCTKAEGCLMISTSERRSHKKLAFSFDG